MIFMTTSLKKMSVVMERRMACLTRSLAASLQDKPFHEHFGVHGHYDLRRINLNKFHLDMCFQKKFVFKFQGIPEDIEQLISSYLHKHFVCTLEIHYEDVFRPPLFSVIHCNTNLYVNLDGLICVHNKKYLYDWTLAFTLEKDILYLICLILSAI
jgi:hypothetical protein